jgi:hypothetical protein
MNKVIIHIIRRPLLVLFPERQDGKGPGEAG